jgi:hypothetical protein
MNMLVTEFVVPPAIVGRNRSVWREIIDTVMEGPPRTAADEITEYLARHQHDLSPTLRIELERRHVCLQHRRTSSTTREIGRMSKTKRRYRAPRATRAK